MGRVALEHARPACGAPGAPALPSAAPYPLLRLHAQLFYALSVIILVSLLLAAWLALVLKKDDATQGGWIAK